MPVSPEQALSSSPKAKLSTEDKAAVDDITRRIDYDLTNEWTGVAILCGTDPADRIACSAKAMAHITRLYERERWIVQCEAIDGKVETAAAILSRDGACEFVIRLTPRWSLT